MTQFNKWNPYKLIYGFHYLDHHGIINPLRLNILKDLQLLRHNMIDFY